MAVKKKREEILVRFRKLMAEKFKMKEEQIKNESKLVDDIGVDSIDFWEVIARVEQEFDIDVEDEDVKDVVTVEDVVNVLIKKLK